MKLTPQLIIAIIFCCFLFCCGLFQHFNCGIHLKNVSAVDLKNQGIFRVMVPPSASEIYILGCRYRGSGSARFLIDDAAFRAWMKEQHPQLSISDIPAGGKEFLYLYGVESTKSFSHHISQGWFVQEEYSEDSGIEIVFDSASNTGYVSWW